MSERRLEKSIELDATPEQVWAAIATGPGIDSWFVPAPARAAGGRSDHPGLRRRVHRDRPRGSTTSRAAGSSSAPGRRRPPRARSTRSSSSIEAPRGRQHRAALRAQRFLTTTATAGRTSTPAWTRAGTCSSATCAATSRTSRASRSATSSPWCSPQGGRPTHGRCCTGRSACPADRRSVRRWCSTVRRRSWVWSTSRATSSSGSARTRRCSASAPRAPTGAASARTTTSTATRWTPPPSRRVAGLAAHPLPAAPGRHQRRRHARDPHRGRGPRGRRPPPAPSGRARARGRDTAARRHIAHRRGPGLVRGGRGGRSRADPRPACAEQSRTGSATSSPAPVTRSQAPR